MSDFCEEQGSNPMVLHKWVALSVLCLLSTACITVKAPEKPIEINLNVKVQQEVVVRLQKDAQELIENNPELFPE